MRFINALERDDLGAAAILINKIEVRDSSRAIEAALSVLTADLQAGQAGLNEELKTAVRQVLRNGKYRPSGRGKPAQEYLAKVWQTRGTLELINNVVDVNNIVSLRFGLPISAFDAEKLRGDVVVRLGAPEERYVFNAAEQILECQDLVVVCDERGPIGSPVKDSQATKLFPGARSVLYVVYANSRFTLPDSLLQVAESLAELLLSDCPTAHAEKPVLFEKLSH